MLLLEPSLVKRDSCILLSFPANQAVLKREKSR
jgi:hypothetical protein